MTALTLTPKKADYLKSILNNFKLDRDETAMVGDTKSDIIAGKANSIYCIGASWGYGQREDLIKVNQIINHPLELVRVVKK